MMRDRRNNPQKRTAFTLRGFSVFVSGLATRVFQKNSVTKEFGDRQECAPLLRQRKIRDTLQRTEVRVAAAVL
jgi:hypothetical protein